MILVACLLAVTAFAAGPAVKIAGDEASFTISNSQLTATISKKTGDLTSLKFHNLEMMGHSSGHPAGYWEQNTGNASQIVPSITIDPASNGGERGEVSIKGISRGKPLGGGGPGGGMLCDLELRYALGRDDSGIYAYAIFSHPVAYPRTQVGESRFGAKLNGAIFDWLSIDAQRNKLMASGADWDQGSPLNMKEARRLTTGVNKGQVEHKYDYSAVQFEIPAFGWLSTKEHVGFYFINPSMEYLSGGATHVELTGHLDDNNGGDPTLLDYWRGTHYGGTNLQLSEGEEWIKVVGPIFIYLNSAADPNAMYRDAMAQAVKELRSGPMRGFTPPVTRRKRSAPRFQGNSTYRIPPLTRCRIFSSVWLIPIPPMAATLGRTTRNTINFGRVDRPMVASASPTSCRVLMNFTPSPMAFSANSPRPIS